MRRGFAGVLSVLYPAKCAGCSRSGEWLCADCLRRCVPFGGARCKRCGAAETRYGCATCRDHIRSLDEVHAAYEYTGPVRQLVHAFKYRNMSGAAEWMAAQMLTPDFAGVGEAELLVSVPMHPSRQRDRGYNQAAMLCTAIYESSGIPMAAALQRKQLREAQARLSAEQRWNNVRGAFAPGTAVVHGHVLLVDDVCTTGATLEECASVLKHMGAEYVTGLVFARA